MNMNELKIGDKVWWLDQYKIMHRGAICDIIGTAAVICENGNFKLKNLSKLQK